MNHSEAEDSLWYLWAITRAPIEYQFHPNHLLYGFVNWLYYRGWSLLGYGGDAELPVMLLNVAAGLAVLALVYRIAAVAQLQRGLRLAAAAGTACAYGFWRYSVECETYIVPLLFALLALDRLMKIHADFGRVRHHLLLGVFVAMAALFHQQYALLAGVVLVSYLLVLVRQGRVIGLALWAGRLMLCGAVCAIIVAGVHVSVLIAVYGRTTPDAMLAWIFSGSTTGGYGYGFSLSSLKAIFGFGRAFFGGHFMFALPPVIALIKRLVPNFDLSEEVFLVADFEPLRTGLLFWGTIVFLLCMVYLVGRRLITYLADRRARREGSPVAPGAANFAALSGPLIAYIAIYTIFGVFYLPESVEVWIALIPALMLGAALALHRIWTERSVPPVLGLALVCLFAVNLWGSMLPQTDHIHDYWYQFNAWLLGEARPGDLVVSGAGYVSDGYVTFYSGARVFDARARAGRLKRGLIS